MQWTPTPKQAIALSSTADETLYGGARAGGKTTAALAWLIDKPYARGLVLRRNGVDLDDFIRRALDFYGFAGIRAKGNPTELVFPSGAVIYTGHLGHPDSYERFQGWEIHRLLIEELTHIASEDLYEKLLASVRSTDKDIPARVFLTTNPGSKGHLWVKKRFGIGVQEPNKPFMKNGKKLMFVPSTVYDNKHILEADPNYVRRLESLPGTTRRQWLEGSWDDYTINGAYYIDAMKECEREGRITDLTIKPHLSTWSFWDIGVNDATVIITIQKDKGRFNIVDCFSKRGGNLQEFVYYLTSLERTKGFSYQGHFLPHDAAQRSINNGLKRDVEVRKLGLQRVQTLPRTNDVIADIDSARGLISSCWFNKETTEKLVEALFTYHAKFNEQLQQYSSKPEHDWASDYADAFRIFAVAETSNKLRIKSEVFNEPKQLKIASVW